jgi:two-component system phosphate regulon sensor histidine kinase PhoR
MKQKVAVAVTSLTLILCIVYLLVSANLARATMDDSTFGELTRICRTSAELVEEAALPQKEVAKQAQELSSQYEVQVAVYSRDGDALYKGLLGSKIQGDLEKFKAQTGETALMTVPDSHGGQILCAYTRLDSGMLLVVGRKGTTLNEAVSGKLSYMALVAFLVAGGVFFAFQIAVNRTNAFTAKVLAVLTSFSEGRFDTRIQGVTGDSVEQTAHFNEVLSRIQDSVYKNRARNQALSTVMNYMQNGILAVDAKLNLILVTPSAKKLLGITGSIYDPVPINQASRDVKLDKALLEAMNQDGVYMTEVAMRTGMGRAHMPVRLYMTPMTKEGQVVGVVALVEDVTELRRLEQVRTDFAANVSHELKTPLTSIKGFVETLQNGAISKPETAQKFLKIIMLEADRLTRLINDILSISRMESGAERPPREYVRLDKMAHEISEMLSILASEKDVTITSRKNKEPSFVHANSDQLEQMLINLIENAIKYNLHGGNVNVSVFNNQKTVNLLVSDTGIGIAEEHLPRLFERFYRVDKGRSRSMGGTGLGLAIVKHIASSMGAMVEVHSKVGEGTEFLITFPIAQPPEEQPPETQKNHDYDDIAELPAAEPAENAQPAESAGAAQPAEPAKNAQPAGGADAVGATGATGAAGATDAAGANPSSGPLTAPEDPEPPHRPS